MTSRLFPKRTLRWWLFSAALFLTAGCATPRVGPPPGWLAREQLVWWLEKHDEITTATKDRARDDADERSSAAPDGGEAAPLRLEAIRRGLSDLAFRAPRNLPVLVANGLLALEAGDRAAAARWLDDALDLDPGHARAAVARAGVSVRAGNLDHARRVLDDAAQLCPDEAALFDALAGVAYLGGEHALAKRQLERAAALGSEPTAARAYHRGLVAESMGDGTAASAFYSEALLLDADHRAAARRLRGLSAMR